MISTNSKWKTSNCSEVLFTQCYCYKSIINQWKINHYKIITITVISLRILLLNTLYLNIFLKKQSVINVSYTKSWETGIETDQKFRNYLTKVPCVNTCKLCVFIDFTNINSISSNSFPSKQQKMFICIFLVVSTL